MNADRPTIIIPAHNEEAVIDRTLRVLLREAGADEFEIVVVCNGCTDATASLVRSRFPRVTVLERREPSKSAAINAGLGVRSGDRVLLLDADIELETEGARALLAAVRKPGTEAAIGHMDVDTSGAHWVVRAFYRVWMEHPYLRNGKFAAAIALSSEGLARIGQLPPVIADDAFLRQSVPPERVAAVDSVRFLVRAPRTVGSLIRVRSRSYRGNRELAALGGRAPAAFQGEKTGLLGRVAARPRLWPAAGVYSGVTIAARFLSRRDTGTRWERDLTTRTPGAN